MQIEQVLTISSAIIKNSEGKVLLLKRSGTKTFKEHWQLPEGKPEKNEKPVDALKRELHEEIGLVAKTVDFENTTNIPLEANGTKYLAIRLIFITSIEKGKILLSSEHSEFGWFNIEEIRQLQLLPGTLESVESCL